MATGNILCYNNIDKAGGCMPDDGSECCFDGAYCPNGYSCSKGSFCCSKSNPNDCIKMTMAMGSVPTLRDTQLVQTPSVPIQYPTMNSLQPAYTLNPNYRSVMPTFNSANPNNAVLSTNAVIGISFVSIFMFCVVLFSCLYYMFLNKEKDMRIRKFEEWVTQDGTHTVREDDRQNLTQNMETGNPLNDTSSDNGLTSSGKYTMTPKLTKIPVSTNSSPRPSYTINDFGDDEDDQVTYVYNEKH